MAFWLVENIWTSFRKPFKDVKNGTWKDLLNPQRRKRDSWTAVQPNISHFTVPWIFQRPEYFKKIQTGLLLPRIVLAHFNPDRRSCDRSYYIDFFRMIWAIWYGQSCIVWVWTLGQYRAYAWTIKGTISPKLVQFIVDILSSKAHTTVHGPCSMGRETRRDGEARFMGRGSPTREGLPCSRPEGYLRV